MHSWLPPHCLSNQCHCITCTLPSSQSANCMMCSTNHHLTCKTVFLRNSPLAPNINYWSYGDKTCVKLRKCVQLTCLDIKGTKWLQSLPNVSKPPLELLCVVALIFWWLGIKYIREARPMKVGPPEKPSDCSVLNS